MSFVERFIIHALSLVSYLTVISILRLHIHNYVDNVVIKSYDSDIDRYIKFFII